MRLSLSLLLALGSAPSTLLAQPRSAAAPAASAPTAVVEEAPAPAPEPVPAPAPPAPLLVTSVQTGIASWYGIHWQGRRTASGVRFDVQKLTAAHRSLPLNTIVRVTNLLNGSSVEVIINDRGPYVGKRVIDLSEAAAKVLSMTKKGLVPVRIETIIPS
jgi:rare lipoprotein A